MRSRATSESPSFQPLRRGRAPATSQPVIASARARHPSRRHPALEAPASGAGVRDHVPSTLKQHALEPLGPVRTRLLLCLVLLFPSLAALRIRGFHIRGSTPTAARRRCLLIPSSRFATASPSLGTASHAWMENGIFVFPTADSQTRIPTLGSKLCAWSNLQMLRANCC